MSFPITVFSQIPEGEREDTEEQWQGMEAGIGVAVGETGGVRGGGGSQAEQRHGESRRLSASGLACSPQRNPQVIRIAPGSSAGGFTDKSATSPS